MSTIDERVVNMKFNNSQFENGVKQTQSSLDKLKSSLKLDDAIGSLKDLQKTGDSFSLASIANGVEGIGSKFTALGVAGVTALANISNRVVNLGVSLAKSITVDPIKAGLDEYNTQLNSVQTIMSNTAASGASLKDVNSTLASLNTYADKTIYNFSEMTKNIGTFTAAGVDLKTSQQSIKGIANLAALSGSNAEQASTAMYQLSQAISSGKVGLQDWNSVVNAGMGGTVFQRSLAQTAVAMGELPKSALKLEGAMKNVKINGESFRDSISSKGGGKTWLSSKVLTNTLKILSNDLHTSEIHAMGFTNAQARMMKSQAEAAMRAATVVKTLPQLIGTVQESVGSGWTTTWQLIFGDFDQAKNLWTGVYKELNKVVTKSANARNNMLKDWQDTGGRSAAIDAISSAYSALKITLGAIKHAWDDIFPPTTGKQLSNVTKWIDNLAKALLGFAQWNKGAIENTFKGLFAILDIGRMIIVGLIKTIAGLFPKFEGGQSSILLFTAGIGLWLVKVRDAIKNGEGLTNFFDGLGKVLAVPVKFIGFIVTAIGKLIGAFGEVAGTTAGKTFDDIGKRLNPLSIAIGLISALFSNFGKIFGAIWQRLQPALGELGSLFGNLGIQITESLKNANFNDILDTINTVLFGGLVLIIKNFLKKKPGKEMGKGFFGSIKEMFEGVTGTLQAMQTNLKAAALEKIAVALLLLTVSVVALSLVDSGKLAAALGAMTVMFTELGASMAVFNKMFSAKDSAKLIALGVAMTIFAVALDLLTIAVAGLGSLDFPSLIKGLGGVIALLLGVAATLNRMKDGPKRLIAAGLGMIAVAVAINILAKAVGTLGAMNLGAMVQGLIGVGSMLAIIAGFTQILDPKKMVSVGLGLVLIGAALNIMATALVTLGGMSPEALSTGLAGMGAALIIIAGAMQMMPGEQLIVTAASLVIVAAALVILAGVLQTIGGMSPEQLALGLVGIGGSLIIIAGALVLMETALPGAAALIIAAGALAILAPVLVSLGGMSWEGLAKGLIMLGGSLLIISAALYAMEFALPGAAALIVAAAALAILAPVLTTLGSMSWEQIGIGLTALAGALGIMALAGLALTPVVATLILFGAAVALLGAGLALAGVGVLAFAVGLTALGAAGAVGAVGLTAMFTAILNLLPLFFQKVGEGIVKLAGVITQGAPAIVGAIIAVLTALIGGIVKMIPLIVDSIFKLVSKMADTLVKYVPKLVSAGMKLLAGILKGIADNITDVATQATRVITKFIDAIGNNSKKIIDSGANMIIKFVNGLADSIRQHTTAMNKAGANLASAIIEGMTNGLTTALDVLVGAARNMAQGVIDTVKAILGIHSPSKVFYDLGVFVNEGFADGLNSGSKDKITQAYDDMKAKLHDVVESTKADVDEANKKLGTLGETKTDNQNAIDKQTRKVASLKKLRDDGKEVAAAKKKVSDLKATREKDTWSVKRAQLALTKANKTQKDHNDITVAEHRLATAKAAKHPSGFAIDQAERALAAARAKHKDTAAIDEAQHRLTEAKNKVKKDDSAITAANKAVTAAKNSKKEIQAVKDAQTELDNLKRARTANNKEIDAANAALAQSTKEHDAAVAASKALETQLADEQAKLAELGQTYEDNNKQLDIDQADLDKKKQQLEDYTNSIKDQYDVLEAFNTQDPLTNEQETLAQYEEHMKKQIEDVKGFTSQLNELRKRGLDDNLYKKFLSEGLDAVPFITQLLESGQNGINDLNYLDGQLADAAGTLGSNASGALYQAGVNAAQGLVDGLTLKKTELEKQMADLAAVMVNTINAKLDIHSPSRVFAKVGSYAAQGLISGLQQSTGSVGDAASGVGQTAVDALKNTMAGIASAVGDNIDVNPTIRPVLDLSSVQKDSGLIGGLLDGQSLAVNGSYSKATSVANGYDSNQEALIALKEGVASASGGTTFIQNNNSPKALSATEIYRQTKNQISMVKGATTK